MRRMLLLTPLLALLLALSCAGAAQAHKVNVFALVENGVITGEGYFSGGGKAMNCPVEVSDTSGQVVARGVTTAGGAFTILLPAAFTPPLRVVLKAGDGHQNDYTLTAQDLGQQPAAATTPPQAQAVASQAAPASVAAAPADDSRQTALMEQVVAKVVEEKLSPLRQQVARLAEQDQSARLRDIIGGLGWIIGLIGLAAWFKRPRP